MKIVQVNSSDGQGGAAMVAQNLHLAYQQRGHDARLMVGFRTSALKDVATLANAQYATNPWTRFWWLMHGRLLPYYGRFRGLPYRLNQLVHGLAAPRSFVDTWQGVENFDYPATRHLAKDQQAKPDILHLHNLHRNYFDLRALPELSRQVPTFVTLHDMWLLAGHCAHAFDCERWTIGCGSCPDLTIYPEIRRDATAENWQRKKEIFQKSKLYVITPSSWLMRRVEQSMLVSAIVDTKVIPHGVDQTIFQPGDKGLARLKLGLPENIYIVLVTANGVRQSPWKDYRTMREAIGRAAARLAPQKILFIALGEKGPEEQIGLATVRFVPYVKDRQAVAQYYQAADIYLHASRAEVFSLSAAEALSCGTPVVATAVGGLQEVVKSLQSQPVNGQEPTGILTAPSDAEALANAVEQLLLNQVLRQQLGQNGQRDSRRRFDFQRQVDDYLDWYNQILRQKYAERSEVNG